MPLTPQELALRLAKFIGVTSLDPNDPSNIPPTFQRGLQPGDVEELAACINAGLQEIWDLMPTALRFVRCGMALPGPAPVTLDLTQGSATVAAFTGHAAWMNGCAVEMAGERNEIVDVGALLFPYEGASGSAIAALVYGDAVVPLAGTVSVVGPLWIGNREVRLLEERETFERRKAVDPGRKGVPEVAWVEMRADPPVPLLVARLRFYPIPDRPLRLVYGARLSVPSVTAADLASATPVPGFPIPHGWDEAVLLPLAVNRLSIHPDFLITSTQKTEIPRQAEAARRIVLGARPMRGEGRMIPVFR